MNLTLDYVDGMFQRTAFEVRRTLDRLPALRTTGFTQKPDRLLELSEPDGTAGSLLGQRVGFSADLYPTTE
ncbi:MAG: hypothetical protein IPP19_05715 [Verrucomicrobia bacterium]|nr:hypothetical protein [Verrucomicrobiota bacterium]